MSDNKLYDLLGVSRNASESEIRKSYKKLAKELHPDKNPNSGDKFKEVAFAHDVLTDPNKREVYNKYGMKGLQEGADGPSFGADDLFSQIFNGGLFGMGGGRRRRQKGEDTIHPLKVSLEQLYNGHISKLQSTKNVLCKSCNGLGGKKGSNVKCTSCRGTGLKVTYRQLGPGMMQQIQSSCRDCNGEGEVINETDRCKTCSGKKLTKESKIIEVHIDKGMADNQKIMFRGEGDQQPDIEAGDLVVILSLKDHDKFTRIHDDLFIEHTITLTEALCGFVFPLKHLDGRDIIIKNPPGQVISPGAVKEVKGEGMPHYRNHFEKGNLYIKFNVTFPEPYFAPEEKILQLNDILPTKVVEMFDLESEHVEEVNLHDCDLKQDQANGSRSEAYDEDEGGQHGPGYTCATH